MDPEEIDATVPPGTPVEHRDGHSVVHTAAGPVTVAHRRGRTVLFADDPAASLPARGGAVAPAPRGRVPRSPVVSAAPERPAAVAPTLSEPDQFGIVTRTYPDGRTERTGPPGAFEAERRHAATVASASAAWHAPVQTQTIARPDGSTVTTDAAGRVVAHGSMADPRMQTADTSPEGLAQVFRPGDAQTRMVEVGRDRYGRPHYAPAAVSDASTPDLQAAFRPGDVDATPTDRYGRQYGAPLPTAEAPSQVATEVPAAELPEAPPAPSAAPQAPVAPSVASRPARVGGGIGRAPEPAPMTAPELFDWYGSRPGAVGDFNALIGQLAQGHSGMTIPEMQEDIGLRHAAAQQQGVANTQAALRQQAQQQAQLEAQRQAALANAQRAYQRSIDRVAQARLDPSRWFRDQGAGGTVGAVIATALGAVGAALQGSDHNWGLEQINQAVERDLQAQQSEIDSARATADLTGNMLNITRQEFTDRQAAMDAAHANMLDQVALQLQAMEADIASDEARLAAAQMQQQLQQQAAEFRMNAETHQAEMDEHRASAAYDLARAQGAQITAQRDAMRLLHMGQGGGSLPTPTSAQLQAYNGLVAGGTPPDDAMALEFGPRWHEMFPHGALQSTNTAEQRAAYDALDSSLTELERMASANPDDIPAIGVVDSRLPSVTDSQRVMRDELDNAVDLMGRLRSGAAISEEEFNRFRSILGASGTEAQFRAGLARIRRELGARLGYQARGSTATQRDDAEVGFSPE